MEKKELVFNNIGNNVGEFSNFDEMFKYSGLDYKVGTTQTYFQVPGTKDYKPLEDKQCIYNMNTNEPLGVVGRGYNIIQNRDAFEIIRPFFGQIKPVWSGGIDGGATAFMQCDLGDNFDIKGDNIRRYLFISNSHDGSSSLKITFSPIRQVCNNMLTNLLRMKTFASIKHTANNSSNIISVTKALEAEREYTQTMKEKFLELREYNVTEQKVKDVINTLTVTDDHLRKITFAQSESDIKISTRKQNIISSMLGYVRYGVGQEFHVDTALWLFNGISSWYQNEGYSKNPVTQLNSIIDGRIRNQSVRAMEIIQEQCC